MKVIGITPVVAKIIETDEENYPTYRRGGPEQWENLMGESWESYYDDGELEAAYQAFKEADPRPLPRPGPQPTPPIPPPHPGPSPVPPRSYDE